MIMLKMSSYGQCNFTANLNLVLRNYGSLLYIETIHQEISRNLEAVRLALTISDRSEIWQASRQLYCRDACQISERYSYHQTSWNIAHARFGVEIYTISCSRDFTRFNGKTSNCLLNRCPGCISPSWYHTHPNWECQTSRLAESLVEYLHICLHSLRVRWMRFLWRISPGPSS